MRTSVVRWIVAFPALFAAPAQAGYVSFDPPKSTFTMPIRMNNHGAAVGYWSFRHNAHGFVRAPDGTIASFDPPHSIETTPIDINDDGTVVGVYQETHQIGLARHHGFIRRPSGEIRSYDAPGASGYTLIRAINKKRTFTGTFTDGQGLDHGFVQEANGRFTSFDAPGSASSWPTTISDDGTIGGFFFHVGGGCGGAIASGFIRAPDGTVTTFDIENGVAPKSANTSGAVAGDYLNQACQGNGFLRQADGTVATFGFNATSCCTSVAGMNKRGTIVGTWMTPKNAVHAFQRAPDGTFALIQPDEHPKSQTQACDINDSGQILGWYTDHDGLHGFLYTP